MCPHEYMYVNDTILIVRYFYDFSTTIYDLVIYITIFHALDLPSIIITTSFGEILFRYNQICM